VHPAASTSSMKNTSAVVTITIFFIWECCPGGYLRIVPLRVSWFYSLHDLVNNNGDAPSAISWLIIAWNSKTKRV
jgi:hypothetical protein